MNASFSRREVLTGMALGTAAAFAPVALASADEARAQEWDLEADLVVVGSGGGMAGAITGAEAGLDVIVLEKLGILGGSTAMHSGVVACGGGTSLQREVGLEDSPEQYRDYLLTCAKGQANEALVDALAHEIPQNYEWLASLGVPFTTEWLYYTGPEQEPYCTAVTPAVKHGAQCPPDSEHPLTGPVIHSYVVNEAQAKGVQILADAPAQRLVVDPDGAVIGVVALVNNEPTAIKARRGVILAAGGMCANPQMLAQYMRFGGMRIAAGCQGATGDGIQMGQAAGADLVNMHESLTSLNTPVPLGTTSRGKERPSFPSIVVNKYGQRFANEDWHSDSVGTLAQGQEDGCAFQIFDSVAYEAVAEDKRNGIVSANTLDDLAAQLGISPVGLEQTVAYWNEHAAQGEDPLFGKAGATVAPLEPPFYGVQVWSYAIVTHFGGLRVDERCNVLRPTGEPINRLYAAGIDAGGWMGRQYPGSGTAVGGTYSMARIAAREIAQLEAWDA